MQILTYNECEELLEEVIKKWALEYLDVTEAEYNIENGIGVIDYIDGLILALDITLTLYPGITITPDKAKVQGDGNENTK